MAIAAVNQNIGQNAFAPEVVLNNAAQIEASKTTTEDFANHKYEVHQAESINNNSETNKQESKPGALEDFISQTLVKWTTMSSAAINALSAPVRLFDDNNPLKKIINYISMAFTKIHLATYSVSGLCSAIRQKNPMLVFSFFTEGVAAFLGLRSIYLFRGIATGIDGAAAGIKDKHKKSDFASYTEGWNHFKNTVVESFKDFCSKFSKDPFHIFKLDGSDIAIFASLIASCGGVIGMTINEKIGGAIRDISGGIGDIGIFKLDNPIAKNAGFAYLGGTILDLAARVFNKGVASILGVNNTGAFERLRDAFHEAAIAFDRAGQYYFLRYNQQNEEHLKTRTRDQHEGYLNFLKQQNNARTIHQPQSPLNPQNHTAHSSASFAAAS